jgi:hypothetical protein
MNPDVSKAISVPKDMKPVFDQIVALIDPACTALLNDEYAQVCHHMTAALCRKRPSPLMRGRLDIWAAAIVHTVGTVNFAFDRTQTPHTSMDELCTGFHTAKSSVGAKSTQIKQILKIGMMDPNWTLPSRINTNPMAWYIRVDGFIVDARSMPLAVQQVAFEKGLIPYIPVLQALDVDSSAG